MAKKITPEDNQANMQNANKGTAGTNRQYSQNQGNRGEQKNPNQRKGGGVYVLEDSAEEE